MKKIIITLIFSILLAFSLSNFISPGYGQNNQGDENQDGNSQGSRGGGGTPEPASIILILGGAATLGIKGLLNKKKQ